MNRTDHLRAQTDRRWRHAVQEVDDSSAIRFACHLIAQNGDPRKPEIAFAQKYFAIQTRRQELSDAIRGGPEQNPASRLARSLALSGARDAGVQGKMSACFMDVDKACTGNWR
jgi:DNA-damage-inducible protein D